ncbi:MAG: hypothetical protein QXT69_00725 [Fervidicoccaceae archaeon]
MDGSTVIQYMAYIMAAMSVVTIAYAVVNYKQQTKALKLYAEYIRMTLDLPEVKKFTETRKRPKIDVGEDREGKKVLVRYYVREMDRDHPSVTISIDKATKRILKTEVKGESEGKKGEQRK